MVCLSVCERFVGVAKCGVLLLCYDFPVFWCMWKVVYAGVVRMLACCLYEENFLAVIFKVEIVCDVCPVLCLLLFYFSTYFFIE